MSNRTGAKNPLNFGWTLHGDGRTVGQDAVVAPGERLAWPQTIGIGVQHVMAMFGSTVLVPALTGFPVTTTLLFTGVGTLIFLLLTANRVPSYLGSSFAFIAPVTGAMSTHGIGGALGGIVIAGAALFVVGLIVQRTGTGWIHALMPPAVMGTIVALIGLNLATTTFPAMKAVPLTTFGTMLAVVLCSVLFRGLLGRLSILLGLVVGYLLALAQGQVSFAAFDQATWVGLPAFHLPEFHVDTFLLFLPVVFVLIAENVGHVKTVGLMTGQNLDKMNGRALMADGVASMVAGVGGGSGTTTYAENIGVMASSRVYSTAAYWVAGTVAILLAFMPKFGAAVASIPPRRPRRRGHRVVRDDRRHGRPHLGLQQGGLLQHGEPHERRRRPHHRVGRELRHPGFAVGTLLRGRHCAGYRRDPGGVPPHARRGPLAPDRAPGFHAA